MKVSADVICDVLSILPGQKEGCYKELYFRLIIITIIIINSLTNTFVQRRNALCIASVFKQKLSTGISESRRN